MKTTKTIKQLIEGNNQSPLPVEVIPNNMGINLCAVESISWEKQEDGQLTSLTIAFTPEEMEKS
jgi:hypothetical protein